MYQSYFMASLSYIYGSKVEEEVFKSSYQVALYIHIQGSFESLAMV